MTLTVGSQVGPYEILSPLGAGGMGEVWRARDTRLNRIVAIKQCKEDFSDRFLREARAIAALNHPNMSPEQAQGQPVDSRSDIFSFGAVLYELLSGRPPFQGSSILDTAAAILRDEPSRLDAPPTLAAIVERCLRKNPANG